MCLSVSALQGEPFHIWTQDLVEGCTRVDNISDEFEGQGHRSKFMVAIFKNVIFLDFDGLAYVDSLS